MTTSFALVAGLLVGAAASVHAAEIALPPSGVFDFQASLDGKEIGRHRFTVRGDVGTRTVESVADFDVRFLGFHAYRYHHQASEQWKGDCLQSLKASTDDDGKQTQVDAQRDGDATTVKVGGATRREAGCVMTFAYWNPAMREQARLLNPQTGKLESVHVERLADGPIKVGDRQVTATHWRVTGPEQPIEVWYSASGEWVGLDSVVGGRHHLSYRLP